MREEEKINFTLISSLVIIFLCVMYYYFSRGYVSNLKDFLMKGDDLMPPINASTFSGITSAFSISYGIGQPIGGFLLDKLGIKYLSPILLLGAAIGTYGFSNYVDTTTAVYLRYFIGACFCISSTAANKYLAMLWSKHFNLFVNLLPVSMTLSAALASSGITRNLMVYMGWRSFLKTYSIVGVVLSVLLFLVLSLVLKNVIKKEEHVESDNIEINKVEIKIDLEENKNVSVLDGIKELIFLPGFVFLSLFAVSISSAAYILMDGWGNTLLGLKFTHLSDNALTLPATINMIGNAFGYFYNIFADRLTIKKQMLIYAIIGILSLAAIIYINLSFTGFLVCCFFLGFTCAAHNIGFVFLQRNLSNKYLGLGFGILNFMCMFFGCALVQKIAGNLLDIIKNKNGIATYVGYHYGDLITMFKFLFVPSIIALFSVLFFKETKLEK